MTPTTLDDCPARQNSRQSKHMQNFYDLALQVNPHDVGHCTIKVIWKEGRPDLWAGVKNAYLFGEDGTFVSLNIKGMTPRFIMYALINGEWQTATRVQYDAWRKIVHKGMPALPKWERAAELKRQEILKWKRNHSKGDTQ